MKITAAVGSVWLICASALLYAQAPGPTFEIVVPPETNNYPLGPDSKLQPGVPQGKFFTFEMLPSRIFPATSRKLTVYVPAAYHPDKPACVYVSLDGLSTNIPTVFDNLIAQKAMPVTIAVGVPSGSVNSADADHNPRFDRSFEFDSLTDRFARFVIDEVLPAVEMHPAPSGERIVLSHDPNDRAIGGGSTGGIGAFTVAWFRPDAFRRVFSSIGTYVGMRGGDHFNVLVRKTEPRPLRIFMQDGAHDEWPGGPEMGDWWMSNLTMERALSFAGYDVRHVWGAGSHNGNQAGALFPDAMRWLWRDYPKPLEAAAPGNPVLKGILAPNETWQLVAEGCIGGLAATSNGQPAAKCRQADPGVLAAVPPENPKLAQFKVVATTVRSNGDTFFTTDEGALMVLRKDGVILELDHGLKAPDGLAFSPDGLWLFVAQMRSRWGMSYRVNPDSMLDAMLDAKEPFYDFEVPAWADDSGAGSVWMDRTGAAYVATRLGVQIFDRNGRVVAILPMPGNYPAASLCFGGTDFDTLYVTSAGKMYKRKLRAKGVPPWSAPITLPRGSAG